MENKTILVLDPTGKVDVVEHSISARPKSLDGLVLGLLDNGKPNFDLFLTTLEKLLKGRYKFSKVIKRRKGHAGLSLPEKTLRELAQNCDVIVNGIGD